MEDLWFPKAVETKNFPPNYRPPLLTVSNHVTVV